MARGEEASEGNFFTNAIAGCREDERIGRITGAIRVGVTGIDRSGTAGVVVPA